MLSSVQSASLNHCQHINFFSCKHDDLESITLDRVVLSAEESIVISFTENELGIVIGENEHLTLYVFIKARCKTTW